MSVQAPIYRFSVAEYQKLGEADVFHEDDRVELLNGQIIRMSPIGYRHVTVSRRLNRLFALHAADRYWVVAQDPFTLDDESQPQPDYALLRPEADEHDHIPEARDVLLIVEISDSSLGYDRNDKLPAYARQGIPEVWIINLVQDVVEVYRGPQGDSYGTTLKFGRDDIVTPLSFPDVEVRVGEILP